MSEQSMETVKAGYDAVYDAVPNSPTFQRLWRTHSLGADFPEGFEHISFVDLAELRRVLELLRLEDRAVLADLGCGMGGPGLWLARESGARLRGIDLSHVAVQQATARAGRVGMAANAAFSQGTFASTGLETASADGATTFDALQYAPDKRAALAETARVLRPGGRFVFTCFELEPERVKGLPVLGDDPVADYAPLLEEAGFEVAVYEEAANWRQRLTDTYQAVTDAKDALIGEMGERSAMALLGEISLTLQLQPYRRRVLAAAVRR